MLYFFQLYARPLLCIMLLFFFTNIANAQFSVYHGMVFPFDNPNNVVHSVGSITYAAPDYSCNVQNNPVSLSYLQQSQLSFSFNQDISEYNVSRNIFYIPEIKKSQAQLTQYNYYPGYLSGAFLSNLFKRKSVVAFSLNKIQSPEHEVWLSSDEYDDLDFQHQRNGTVWNAALGINYELPFNMNIGLSWSKWFGSWNWHDENASEGIRGRGEYQFNGNLLSLGLLKRIEKLSMCFIFHPSFNLTKNHIIFISYGKKGRSSGTVIIKQNFNDAFKIGFAYRLNDKFTFSTGYRYQGEITMINQLNGSVSKNLKILETFDQSHQFAFAGKYNFHFKKIKLPVFLAYWANWLPKTNNKIPKTPNDFIDYLNSYYNQSYLYYQFLDADDNSKISNNLAIGFQYPCYLFLFHFSGQWNLSTIAGFNSPQVPFSTIIYTSESFAAKKSKFIFTISVSYTFNKLK